MKKALFILGLTATGKTALGIYLAKKLGGVIFSADSIQTYIGLDIISGKDLATLKNTKVHLLDVVSPHESFNVSDFLKEFEKKLKEVDKNKLPIIVGGTAFYISALVSKVQTVHIPPNTKLRKKFENYSVQELQRELEIIDYTKFQSMNNSDRNNPRRLVRAIEIAENRNYESRSMNNGGLLDNFDVKIIGLFARKEVLRKKIGERVNSRMREGAVEEARNLFKQYEALAPQIKTASGYKQLFSYLGNELSLKQAVETWKIAEIQNAKKQMTFFKKIKGIKWFNVSNKDFLQKVEEYAQAW